MNISRTHYPLIVGLITQNKIRDKELSMAIGYLFAEKCPQPAQKSDTANSYFVGTYGEDLDRFLNKLNDIAPVDYKSIRNYAQKFFVLRHFLTFGDHGSFVMTGNALYDLFGFSAMFSSEELATMATPGGQFYNYVNLLNGIVCKD